MFAEEIRRAAEAAPLARLVEVSAALWKAFAAGGVTEAEAEAISGLIEARKGCRGAGAAPPAAPRRVGSRPRTDASLERRRRWAASGRLPPQIAARFTLAEQAVLALVAAETVRRKDCRLAVGNLAALAGVSETTVRNAIREAAQLGLVTVQERKITGWRNDTNVVRIVSADWQGWLRLTRKHPVPPPHGGGCKSAKGTPTEVLTLGNSGTTAPSQGLPGTGGRPRREGAPGIRAGGGGGRAMR